MQAKTEILVLVGLLCSTVSCVASAAGANSVVVPIGDVVAERNMTQSGPATVVYDSLSIPLDLPTDLVEPGESFEIDIAWEGGAFVQFLAASPFQYLNVDLFVGDPSMATGVSFGSGQSGSLEFAGNNVTHSPYSLRIDRLSENTTGLVSFEVFPHPVLNGLVLDEDQPAAISGMNFRFEISPFAISNEIDLADTTLELSTWRRLPDDEAAVLPPMLSIQLGAGLQGDYNADGFVSQADLDLVLLNWGGAVLPTGFSIFNIEGGQFDGLISQNELD